MTKRIFRAICIVAAAVLLASIILIMGVLYEYFTGIRKSELKIELSLAADAVEENGLDYLKSLEVDNCRFTWIDKSGKVLFDSKKSSDEMENHLEREEVREAFETGYGESQRYSSTIMEKTLYRAQRLSDGTVLRISVSQATVPLLLIGIIQPVLIVVIFAVIIAFILASKLSKSIVKPLNELNLDKPLDNETYEELSPLLKRVSVQQKNIERSKDELFKRKKEFQTITAFMNEGLILLDKDKKIISLNPSAEIFLTAKSECIGKSFIEIDRTLEITEALEQSEKGSGKLREIQLCRDGSVYQLHITCIHSNSEMSGFVILILDVTDKQEAEARRREFTANVSHELKSPLQSIMGRAELIENGMVISSDIPQFAGNIRTEARRLVELINDIIRLSRLDEGTNLMYEELDLFEVAKNIAESCRENAAKENISLYVSGDTTVIKTVKPLVSEMIYNLVDNAIKYNRKNGKVTVRVGCDENGAFAAVEDTGIGIPQNEQQRVFERFYRVDKSHSKETGGTGLGLAIVKHAAEDIGADIQLDSTPDNGTKVTVRFYSSQIK